MKTKLKIIIPIIVAVAAIIIAVFAINFTSDNSIDINSLISTAQNYLNANNYEQAIAEFNKIIELDPMNVDAYIGLAQAYQGKGDIDKAIETLKTGYEKTGGQRLEEMLDRLLNPPEETTATTTTTVTTTETITTATAPANEIVELDDGGYYEMAFNTNGDIIHEDFYDENGNNWGSADVEYYPNVNKKTETYYREDGTYYVKEYDENGKVLKQTNYNSDGSIYFYEIWEYDQNGNMTTMVSYYGDDNSLRSRKQYQYDENNYETYMEFYDSLRYCKEVYTDESMQKENNSLYRIEYNDNYAVEYTYPDSDDATSLWDGGNNGIKECYAYNSDNDYYHIIYDFDSSGKNILYKYYTSNNGEPERYSGYCEYEYNENEQPIEDRSYYVDWEGNAILSYKTTYTYDGLGNTLVTTEYSNNGTILWQKKY